MQKPDEFVQAPGYKNLYRRYESDVQKEKQYQHSLLLVLSQSCSNGLNLMCTRENSTNTTDSLPELQKWAESDVQKEKQYQHSLLLVLSQSCSTKASLMNTREYHTSNKVCQRKLGRCKGSVAATVLLFCGKTCPVVACRPWRTKTKLTCSIMQMHDQLHCLAQCQHMTETYKCRC